MRRKARSPPRSEEYVRFCLLILFFCANAFAYKDSFYIGAYGALIDGTLDKKVKADLESEAYLRGVRLGWNNNMRSPFLAKIRWEFFGERRDFTYKVGGEEKTKDGWHAGASVSLGYNVDWLLTQEIVPYIKFGAGVGNFDKDFEDGSNLHLGVGLAFSFRYFELTAEARREFWQ
jgi:hypothetical protein